MQLDKDEPSRFSGTNWWHIKDSHIKEKLRLCMSVAEKSKMLLFSVGMQQYSEHLIFHVS